MKWITENFTMAGIISWLVCAVVSLMCGKAISGIFDKDRGERRLTAYCIAIIIGAVITVSIFKSNAGEYVTPHLGNNTVFTVALLGLFIGGYLAMLLERVPIYGGFFHITTLTITIGLSIYARVSALSRFEALVAAAIVGALTQIAMCTLSRAQKADKLDGVSLDN